MKESSSPGVPTPHKDRPNVLPLDGEIDLNVLPDVTTALNGMIAKKPQQLVVDLSRVTYIDSAGVAALIHAMQGVEAYGGKFALARPSPDCARRANEVPCIAVSSQVANLLHSRDLLRRTTTLQIDALFWKDRPFQGRTSTSKRHV